MERKPNGDRVLACILSFITGCFAVVMIFLYVRETKPVTASIGTLADRNNDFIGRRIVITNCGTGKRVGRYLFFDTIDPGRHCVVLSLADSKVEPTVTTFRGYVVGIFDEAVPTCHHEPPFLFVIDVKPATEP